jgi:DNA-directed RNA polymerase specialized sigma24 family protein
MRQPFTAAQPESSHLARLRVECSHVALGLFTDADEAEEEIEQMFGEIPATLQRPKNRASLEAWLLAEVVQRARRHAREAVERQQRRERAEASAARVWKQLHRRGDLVPLLQQLPAVYAEVFALHYIERAPLSEMMRRTGASAGVITHRIAQASERLHALTSSARFASDCRHTASDQ